MELWRLSCSVSPSPLPFISLSLILSCPGYCKLLTCIICTLTVVTEFYNNLIRVENMPLSVTHWKTFSRGSKQLCKWPVVFFFQMFWGSWRAHHLSSPFLLRRHWGSERDVDCAASKKLSLTSDQRICVLSLFEHFFCLVLLIPAFLIFFCTRAFRNSKRLCALFSSFIFHSGCD